MARLHVHVLGSVDARTGDGVSLQLSPATARLLGWLALFAVEAPARREALAEALWPDCAPDRSRSRLSSALWRLRRALGRDLEDVVVDCGETVRLAEVWVDAKELWGDIQRVRRDPPEALDAERARALDATLQLYRDPLLIGHDLPWVLEERQRFSDAFCYGLERLLAYFREKGRRDLSIEAGRAILRRDPLREDIHAQIIRLYGEAGRRPSALDQFERCRAAMATELGLEPSEARRALAGAISGAGDDLRALMVDIDRCMVELRGKVEGLRRLVAPEEDKPARRGR